MSALPRGTDLQERAGGSWKTAQAMRATSSSVCLVRPREAGNKVLFNVLLMTHRETDPATPGSAEGRDRGSSARRRGQAIVQRGSGEPLEKKGRCCACQYGPAGVCGAGREQFMKQLAAASQDASQRLLGRWPGAQLGGGLLGCTDPRARQPGEQRCGVRQAAAGSEHGKGGGSRRQQRGGSVAPGLAQVQPQQ